MDTATILAATLLALPFARPATAATPDLRPVGEFQSIEFRGAGHLVVTAGQPAAVAVTASPARLPAVVTQVRKGVLVVEQTGAFWHAGDANVTVDVHVPQLAGLTVTGAADATLSGLNGGQTILVLTGASRLTARGSVDQLVTRVEGAARADLSQLVARQVVLTVNGAAQVALPVRTPLVVSRDGVGSLTSAERMDHPMQSTMIGSRILR
jgi:hypothetical protein